MRQAVIRHFACHKASLLYWAQQHSLPPFSPSLTLSHPLSLSSLCPVVFNPVLRAISWALTCRLAAPAERWNRINACQGCVYLNYRELQGDWVGNLVGLLHWPSSTIPIPISFDTMLYTQPRHLTHPRFYILLPSHLGEGWGMDPCGLTGKGLFSQQVLLCWVLWQHRDMMESLPTPQSVKERHRP